VTDPAVLVLRIDGPLFFADVDHFRSRVHELALRDDPPTGVVVDAESVFLTDTDGADILVQLAGELRARGSGWRSPGSTPRASTSGRAPGSWTRSASTASTRRSRAR
jgi:MFS superfamily sulfate permease-like transporter